MALKKEWILILMVLQFSSQNIYAFGRKKPPSNFPPPVGHVPPPIVQPEEPAPPIPPPESPPQTLPENYIPKLTFPERPLSSVSGSSFLLNAAASGLQRESQILEEVRKGNIPYFLRKWIPIKSKLKLDSGEESDLTFFVLPDYLSLGSDSDFVRIPLTPQTVQKIMDYYEFVIPTRKMVQLIFEQSKARFQPEPLTPGNQMSSNAYYQNHQNKIEVQRKKNAYVLGDLFMGIKKDIVISTQLKNRPDRVAIFGWHYPNGKPIQNLNVTSHSNTYVDYSHGVRFVASEVILDGKVQNIYDLWSDSKYASHLSDEGILLDPRAAYK